MHIEQSSWSVDSGWNRPIGALSDAGLVLAFADRTSIQDPGLLRQLRSAYPEAIFFGCSTAGEIYDTSVQDNTLVSTAISFESTQVRHASLDMQEAEDSFDAGVTLGMAIPHEQLTHVFVLSDGIEVNGSELVRGLAAVLPSHVSMTGGLSADGDRFQQTFVLDDNGAKSGSV